VNIRRIDASDEVRLRAYMAIRNTAMPDSPDSLDQVSWEQKTYPGEVTRLLAEDDDGIAIGTASTGRIWMHERTYERFWLGIWVPREARRRGIGSALYAAASDVARAAGKTGFQTGFSEAHAEGHRFLANRGFVETDRAKVVRLDLAGVHVPQATPPAGIRLVTLAQRPDLVPGVHAVATDAFPDIPSSDRPIDVGELEEFAARDVHRAGIPQDGFFVALDEGTGEVAGYASLMYEPGSTTVAYHDMTAVARAYRGRGIATALKRATIAWAATHGIEALETGNDQANAPMRAVNAAIGYRPLPDWIGLQGPLASER
jgi:GNAT superfamily N-acetyltransferase